MLKPNKKAVAASVLSLSLLLSACGGDKNKLDDVLVDLKNATAEPSVSFTKPFSVDNSEVRILEEGTGESIEDGDTVLAEVTTFNGANGNVESSTYKIAPVNLTFSEALKKDDPDTYNAVVNLKIGGSFMRSTNVKPQTQPGSSGVVTATPGTPSEIEVYTLKKKVSKYASGEAQTPDSKLPQFTLDESTGKAEIKMPQDKGEAPTKLISKDLIVGTGEKVKETDNVYARYIGVRWEDGKVFEDHFSDANQPIVGFPLIQVIPGWQQGLVGKTVGSRVELVIPANLAYGDNVQGGQPSGALVFVVDIIDAAPNHTAPQALEIRKQMAASASANPSGASATPAPSADTAQSPSATEQKPNPSSSAQ